MASNIELQLIGKIIETQDFHTVEKLRINDTFFLSDSQTKEVFRFIREHYHNELTYGSVPSWALLQQRFYGFPYVPSTDTVATLCQEIRRYKMRADLLSLVDDINTRVDVEPKDALDLIRQKSNEMYAEHEVSNDMFLASAYEHLYAEYNMISQNKGIIGIPFPWDIMNEDTQGMQDGQFLVIYGRPKSMKTWVALVIAAFAYMRGMRVLVYSLEMNEKMILRRVAAIIAQVDYAKFKNGTLDPATQQRVWQILACLKDEELTRSNMSGHSSAFLATQPRGTASGVNTLQAKIREFDPDLVIVDGMYLMRDDRQKIRNIDWKSVAHVSQDLKATATQFQIPIIGVTQANRSADKDPKKADLAELAYADAIAQDCDLCMRVHKQKDPGTHETELVLSFPGGRETTLEAFVINAIPSVNFQFKRAQVVDPNQAQQPTQQGQGGGGGKGGKGGPSGPPILPSWGRS